MNQLMNTTMNSKCLLTSYCVKYSINLKDDLAANCDLAVRETRTNADLRMLHGPTITKIS
jgi:hypothetical protein